VKRFRFHGLIIAAVAIAVVIILLSHAIRVRLEWATGGFIVGVVFGVLLVVDSRRHRKRRRDAGASSGVASTG
jgi:membrane associated rhomboid family serine protease